MPEEHLSVTLARDLARILSSPQEQSDGDLAECLLTAAELGVRTPNVEAGLREFVRRAERGEGAEPGGLLGAIRRQHVLARYDVALPVRLAFLDQWIENRGFSGRDLVSVAAVVGLAIEQLDLVSPAMTPYVREWFVRHSRMRSLRTMAWTPHYLRLVGSADASLVATAVLTERDRNGSWESSVPKTVACAFALSRYLAPDFSALQPTLAWVIRRFEQGLVDGSTVLNVQALKLLAATAHVPTTARSLIETQLALPRGTIFISHNHQDKAFVRELAADLVRRGVRPWVDEAEILPGESIVAKVSEALDRTEAVAIVLSRASVASPWVKREVNAALASMLAGKQIRLIPLVIDDCEVPTLLRDIYWVDFRTDYAVGLDRLLSAFPARPR